MSWWEKNCFNSYLALTWYWNYIGIPFSAMYLQWSDFKCANLFHMVKNNFILLTEVNLQNNFPLNISNFAPHKNQILKSFNQSKIESGGIAQKCWEALIIFAEIFHASVQNPNSATHYNEMWKGFPHQKSDSDLNQSKQQQQKYHWFLRLGRNVLCYLFPLKRKYLWTFFWDFTVPCLQWGFLNCQKRLIHGKVLHICENVPVNDCKRLWTRKN